jgi:hypothetical protein
MPSSRFNEVALITPAIVSGYLVFYITPQQKWKQPEYWYCLKTLCELQKEKRDLEICMKETMEAENERQLYHVIERWR